MRSVDSCRKRSNRREDETTCRRCSECRPLLTAAARIWQAVGEFRTRTECSMEGKSRIKTTLVGSYPVPDWLTALPSEQALIDATRVVMHMQEQAGIDV